MSLEAGGRDWSPGSWFGTQLGCTLWLLLLGAVLLGEDHVTGAAAFVGFVAANAWGLRLWRRRARMPGRVGMQRLLAGIALVVAIVVVLANVRAVAVDLPYWTIAVVPACMVLLGRPRPRARSGT